MKHSGRREENGGTDEMSTRGNSKDTDAGKGQA